MKERWIIHRTASGLLLVFGGLGVAIVLPVPNPPDPGGFVGVAAMVVAGFGFYLMAVPSKQTAPEHPRSPRSDDLPLPLRGRWSRAFTWGFIAWVIVGGFLVLIFPSLIPDAWYSSGT